MSGDVAIEQIAKTVLANYKEILNDYEQFLNLMDGIYKNLKVKWDYHTPFSQGSGVIAEERAERIQKLEVVEHYYESLFSRLHRDVVHMNSQELPCKVKVDKIEARNGRWSQNPAPS